MPLRSAAATRADARGASFDTTWFTCRTTRGCTQQHGAIGCACTKHYKKRYAHVEGQGQGSIRAVTSSSRSSAEGKVTISFPHPTLPSAGGNPCHHQGV